MHFPVTIDAITPEFLSSVFDAEVTDLTVTPVEAQGALSDSARVAFRTSDPDQLTTVFAKVAHGSEVIRDAGRQLAAYVREVRFYETLGADRALPVPQCHFAAHEESDASFLLLLEDLSAGRVGNYFRSSVRDVEQVLDELPSLHARWWDGADLSTADWLWRADHPAVTTGYQQGLETTAPITVDRYPFDPSFIEAMHSLARRFSEVATRWSERPITLVHGDLHLQQVFFPTSSGGRFALFDWQTAMIANPGIDLARVITTDLTAEDRRTHERALVARYHAGLVAAGVDGYDLDDCWLDYRLGQVWGAMMLMNAGSVIPVEAAEQMANASGTTAAEFVGRVAEAWADLEVGEFLG